MATGKRYYWIKLKESFMTSDTVDYLMSQPNGANYVVLYQMLCIKTINTEGKLSRQIGEILMPYDIKKIQRDCKWFSINTIRAALDLYRSFGLIYEDQDGSLVLANHSDLVGSETDYAEKNRRMREQQQNTALHNTGHIVSSVVSETVSSVVPETVSETMSTDIRDKDIRDIYKCTAGARTRTRARTVPVPIPKNANEVAEYCKSEGLEIDVQRFFDTYERQHWRLNGPNGSPIHDWRAIAKMWSQGKIDRSANKARKASFDTSDFFAAALKKSYERSGSPIGISASTEQTEGATS